MRRREVTQIAVMFIPDPGHQQQHDEDNKALLSRCENKDGEEPFHLPA